MKVMPLVIALVVMLHNSDQSNADCADYAGADQIINGSRASVLHIETIGPGLGCNIDGTGFLVSNSGYVLTAAHVVPKGVSINPSELSLKGTGQQLFCLT